MPVAFAIASYLLAGVVGVASLAGLLLPRLYAHEHPTWAAQGLGQDAVTLALVVPLLVAATRRARAGSVAAQLVWAGCLVYLAYSYALYALFVHFGPAFPLYVAALGLSCYLLVGWMLYAQRTDLARAFPEHTPVRLAGGVLVGLGLVFYGLWSREVVQALLSGRAPASATAIGFPVNPIHVLDMALLLPGLVLAGLALLRRRPLGYLMAAPLLVALTLLGVAILAMAVVMHQRGFPASGAMLVAIVASAGASLAVTVRLLLALRR